jgi:MFS family permease
MTSLTAQPSSTKEFRRVIWSSYLGSTIEFYDFLLYATAASLVFGPVFFTGLDPVAGTIASYGTFAAGYLARPLGGAVFGHFGDRLGRKRMLVVSMTLMGVASFLIGLIPPASAIGSWGAIILVLLRICQGVSVGGEWGGAALMSLEHAEKGRRGFAASFTNAGAPTGSVLGTLMMTVMSGVLTDEQFLSWGWRIPFLLSAVLLVVGLYVRAKVSESALFQAAMARPVRQSPPILQVFRRPKTVVLVALGCCGSFAMQIVFATFAITYAASHGTSRSTALLHFGVAAFVAIFVVLLTGRLSDRVGRRPVMITGFAAFAVLVFPIFGWLGSGNAALVFLAFLLGLICQSLTYGPMAAFISEQFGTRVRYTGASVGYQLATLIGAGMTPLVLASLYASSGKSTTPVAWLLVGICALSVLAIVITGETRHNDLAAED